MVPLQAQKDQGSCFTPHTPQSTKRSRINKRFPKLPPQLHCVDPMPGNIQLLQNASRAARIPAAFQIHHAAVGATSNPATIPFPDIGTGGMDFGEESVGVGFATSSKGEGIPVVQVRHASVDTLFGNLARVDMLMVDTEGNDPLVLLGAPRVLQKVRYLEFENHEVGAWRKYSFQHVIDYLDNLSFDCYWTTNNGGLYRITGCWHANYAKVKLWSNVACAKRGDSWWHVMRRIWADAKAADEKKQLRFTAAQMKLGLAMVWNANAEGLPH